MSRDGRKTKISDAVKAKIHYLIAEAIKDGEKPPSDRVFAERFGISKDSVFKIRNGRM